MTSTRYPRNRQADFLQVALLFLLFATSTCHILAQTIVGSIGGVITDSSGAVVPNAGVTVVSVATNATRYLKTNAAGVYTVSALPPGAYHVHIQANGFENFAAQNVEASAGGVTSMDAALVVGSSSETVNVNAATGVLQTESAEVRAEIDNDQLNHYPIPASRNCESSLLLVPGMTPPLNSNSLGANPSRGLIIQTNGAFGTANNIRIDGAAAVNVWLPHVAGYNPG